jgi:hypothetical protein
MHYHLLIPDLLWPEPGDSDTMGPAGKTPLAPALAALLAAAQLTRGPASSAEQLLAHQCGLGDAPLAPLRLLGEANAAAADASQGWWLCADPIHLRLAQEQVFAAGGEALAIEADEAAQLVAALNQTFADIGHFHAATPERWYLRLQQPLPFPAPPASVITGRRLGSQLPKGKAFAPLLSFLIEAQMLLHSHPLNRRREDSQRITANSLWLWGGGELAPASPNNRIAAIWSQDALAQGIARQQQLPCQPPPASAAALLQAAPTGAVQGMQLIVLDDLSTPTRLDDGYTWRQTLERLEADWFAPLQQALAQGRIGALSIGSCGSYGSLAWQVPRPGIWQRLQGRFRQPEALAAQAQRLAESNPATPG